MVVDFQGVISIHFTKYQQDIPQKKLSLVNLPPPLTYHPRGNKALLRAYQPLVSLKQGPY